jgi:hypothetical protein
MFNLSCNSNYHTLINHICIWVPVKCETKSKRNETKRSEVNRNEIDQNETKRHGIIQNEIKPILTKEFLGEIQDKN